MTTEERLNAILSKRGFLLKYEETFPSSNEDMYEMKVWIEDNLGTNYAYKNIYVRNCKDPKSKAFRLLIDGFIDSYCQTLGNETTNNIV
jgi:hypothetical protein